MIHVFVFTLLLLPVVYLLRAVNDSVLVLVSLFCGARTTCGFRIKASNLARKHSTRLAAPEAAAARTSCTMILLRRVDRRVCCSLAFSGISVFVVYSYIGTFYEYWRRNSFCATTTTAVVEVPIGTQAVAAFGPQTAFHANATFKNCCGTPWPPCVFRRRPQAPAIATSAIYINKSSISPRALFSSTTPRQQKRVRSRGRAWQRLKEDGAVARGNSSSSGG